jgi:hypothetical protein
MNLNVIVKDNIQNPMSKSIIKEYHDYTHWTNEQGQWHREGAPARVWTNGDKEWHNNGYLHRLDGPAAVYVEGVEWFVNDNKINIY